MTALIPSPFSNDLKEKLTDTKPRASWLWGYHKDIQEGSPLRKDNALGRRISRFHFFNLAYEGLHLCALHQLFAPLPREKE